MYDKLFFPFLSPPNKMREEIEVANRFLTSLFVPKLFILFGMLFESINTKKYNTKGCYDLYIFKDFKFKVKLSLVSDESNNL